MSILPGRSERNLTVALLGVIALFLGLILVALGTIVGLLLSGNSSTPTELVPTLTPTFTPTIPPTLTPTETPTATPTPTPSPTRIPIPISTPTRTPTYTPTRTPTITPTATWPAPVVTLTASTSMAVQGQPFTLSWYIQYVIAAYLSGCGIPGEVGITGPNGSRQVSCDVVGAQIYRLRALRTGMLDVVRQATVEITPNANLGVSKADAPDPVTAGTNLTYTLTVTNNGPSAASSVTVSDPLPAQTTFQSVSAPGGWTCTTPVAGTNGTVSCTKSSMTNGESATFTIAVQVSSTASGTLSNTVTVSSSTADLNTTNNTDSEDTTVTPPTPTPTETVPTVSPTP